jgi:predicted Zn-dependent protease
MSEEPIVVRVIPGTPPSPEDPFPSNQTITEFSDDSSRIETRPPDEKVLAEYVAALAEHPDHPKLRLYYGIALQGAGKLDDALAQFREAVRLDPASSFAHSMLASALRSTAATAEAVTEYREALRLFCLGSDGTPNQQEVTLRWGLANALHQDDREPKAAPAIGPPARRMAMNRRGSVYGVPQLPQKRE